MPAHMAAVGDPAVGPRFWECIQTHLPGGPVATDRGDDYGVIVSGWVGEIATTPEGRRQVFAIYLPGEIVRLSRESTGRSLVALTSVSIGDLALLRDDCPARRASRIEAASRRAEEQLLNQQLRLGRLTAVERVLHLLLELRERLHDAGLVHGYAYRLPVTQLLLADALGLSLVHMNRTLQELRRRELITLRRGTVTLHNPAKLSALAGYERCRAEEAQASSPNLPAAAASLASRTAVELAAFPRA